MKSLLLLLSLFFVGSLEGQLVVQSNGNVDISGAISTLKINNSSTVKRKVFVGTPNSTFDPYNEITLGIFGPNGKYKAGGKLSFGDIGRKSHNGFNVFIGEYDITDTDELWLHGKKGIRWTNGGAGDQLICNSYNDNGNKFRFYVPVLNSQGVYIGSDKRFKENIKKIENSLKKLLKLRGVSYNLKNTESLTSGIQDEKSKDMILNPQKSQKKYGYIAQDLQTLFPDLIMTDDTGYLHIDYIGLIPHINEAIKSQQHIIEKQDKRIEKLEKIVAQLYQNSLDNVDSSLGKVFQNTPNPYSERTVIGYKINNQRVNDAEIVITNLQGEVLRTIVVDSLEGEVTLDASEFSRGVYIYSLINENIIIDSKKMIVL